MKRVESTKERKGGQMRKAYFIAMVSLVLLFTVAAFAQGGARGEITGTVTDPTGAVIPKAEVTITNQETGVTERTITTGSQGTFTATVGSQAAVIGPLWTYTAYPVGQADQQITGNWFQTYSDEARAPFYSSLGLAPAWTP